MRKKSEMAWPGNHGACWWRDSGFHIVEFYNEFNVDPNCPEEDQHEDERPDEMFRFLKVMK